MEAEVRVGNEELQRARFRRVEEEEGCSRAAQLSDVGAQRARARKQMEMPGFAGALQLDLVQLS